MSHIALYRAWRPQAFREIAGQEHIVKTLQNALREGRYSHAYLFSGPRGTGKTSAAKILARAVNCERAPAEEPCNECEACRKISDGSVMDVVEIDAASNRGVEEIRDLRENVKYAPSEVRCKVFMIDEVHMLTTEAFNALLKTLEEPPAHVVFVLATTEPHRIPATIHSRCQRFDFRRISPEDQLKRLEYVCEQEGIEIDDDALRYIARLSDGGMRDALSLLDQIVAYAGKRITLAQVVEMTGGMESERFAELSEAIRNRDVGRALDWVAMMMQEGKSAEKCLENLILYFRDLLMILTVPGAENMTDRILDVEAFRKEAEQYDRSRLFEMIDVLNRYYGEMKYAAHPRTLFEVALMKICSDDNLTSTAPTPGLPASAAVSASASSGSQSAVHAAGTNELLRRIAQLEEKVAALERRSASALSASTGVAAGMGSGPFDGGVRAGSRSAPSPARMTGKPVAPGRKAVSQAHLQRLKQEKNEAFFDEVCRRWGEALALLKERKVTVHAWLVNGEPVLAGDEFVLVGFKNTIHRETTEKPANRTLIEQVLQETFGKQLRLETIMLKDWQNSLGTAESGENEPAELKLEPEAVDGETGSSDVAQSTGAKAASAESTSVESTSAESANAESAGSEASAAGAHVRGEADSASAEAGSTTDPASVEQEAPGGERARTGKYEQEWINKAIELFGEELVTVKNDRED